MLLLGIIILLAATTGRAANISVGLYGFVSGPSGTTCFGVPVRRNFSQNTCTNLEQDGGTFMNVIVTCDAYYESKNRISVYSAGSPTSCPGDDALIDYETANNNCLDLEGAFQSYNNLILSGCPPVMYCNSTVSQWSQWSSTCGSGQRTRSVSCVFANGNSSPCSTCLPVESVQQRQVHCVSENETISTDYCNRTSLTAYVSLDNAEPFNTPSGFWKNSPFTNGWTMQLLPFTSNGSIAFYSLLPEVVVQSDIVITSGDSLAMTNLIVASHPIAISNGLGTCSLFRFTGNNITIMNMNIVVPFSCYELVPLGANLIFHGSTFQFAGMNAYMSNIMVSGSVVAFLIASQAAAGRVEIRNLAVGSQMYGPIRTSSDCWAGHVFANSGNISVHTVNSTCVTSVSYGSSALKVQTSNGIFTDATMVITNKVPTVTPSTTRSNRASDALGSLIPLIVLAVIALLILFFAAFKILKANHIFEADALLREQLLKLREERKKK